MDKRKFILVQDEKLANKLLSHGFNLISNISGMYTFENRIPNHFQFEDVDIKKLVYTDKLVF